MISIIVLLVGLSVSSSQNLTLNPCPTGDDVTVVNGVVTWKPEPCMQCVCKNNEPQCIMLDCMDLTCPGGDKIYPPGECCPICSDGTDTTSD